MKRYIISVLALFIFATNVNAESPTDKGVYSLSGSFSYSHVKIDNDDNITTYSLSPKLVYFLYPNFALGSSILYSKAELGSSNIEGYGLGPVVRYYFGKDTIYPFIALEYLFMNTKGSASEYDRNDLALGFGMNYFLSKNVAIEPMVEYVFREYESDSSIIANREEEALTIRIGINVFIF